MDLKKEGKSALQWAVALGHMDMVSYFVEECNADLNALDQWGYSSLHHAFKSKDPMSMTRYLVEQGADLDGKLSVRSSVDFLREWLI